jgi:hypothetical protein
MPRQPRPERALRALRSLLLAPLLAACTVVGARTTEEPRFEVVARLGDAAEVRRYAPRLLAEIEVAAATEETARNAGFRPLAAYIFGENEARERIGMTAPVTQGRSGGERIGMTAPVTQSRDGEVWRIGFLMPARYASLDALPTPRDARIALRELPGETVAVRRFSGVPSAEAVAAARARLFAALQGSGWRAAGEGGAWFYDPPWTVPALRRSEVWVPVTRA